MREDLEKQLYELGPILYQEKDLPMNQTCMCWGFECPDSWFNILKDLTIELENINNNYKGKYECVARQVKSKYGSLRFYYYLNILIKNSTEDEVKLATELDNKCQAIIDKAEVATTQICCLCGKQATKVSKGWISFYCDDCFNKD